MWHIMENHNGIIKIIINVTFQFENVNATKSRKIYET